MLRCDADFNLSELTAPDVEPVSLADARRHVAVDSDMTENDALISGLIRAARDYCENALSRAFVRRSFLWTFGRFPGPGGRIMVPRPPLFSVEEISYVDYNGISVVLDSSRWRTVGDGGTTRFQGAIVPAYGTSFPSVRRDSDACSVTFTAGYSDDASGVPDGIKAAILLLVGHWYKYREEVTGGTAQRIPMGVDALLSPYQWGFYA